MLTVEDLALRYDGFELLADWSIEAGTKTAILGPSGAGKSTLIHAIAGFLPIMQGCISWQDQDLGPLAPGQRPVATLFQDGNLFPHLSAAQNIGLGLRPDLKLSTSQHDQVADALHRVGLDGYGPRKPAQLSGGQQSRVALARVLVQARPLILLDEPFAALGPALRADMLDLVAGLADDSGATLVMVSHDPADARRIADQVILVAEGRAHPPQPTDALLDNPPPALRDYLG